MLANRLYMDNLYYQFYEYGILVVACDLSSQRLCMVSRSSRITSPWGNWFNNDQVSSLIIILL